MSCHPSAVRQVKSRFALPRRLGPFPSRLAPSEPPCRALFTLHSLHIVSGIAIGKTGMFPSSRTPEGLTPDSLGSSSVACRLGCLLRKLSQTRARPTRLTAAQPTSAATRPGFSLCRCRSRANSSQLAPAAPQSSAPHARPACLRSTRPSRALAQRLPPPSCPCFSSGPAGRALAAAFE